jgi:hypothetical protein
MRLIENYNHFLGEIIRNPRDGAGSDINIETGVFVPNDPPGVYRIDNMAHYNGVLLSVHFATDTWSTVEGSAVMVAPGIALAAEHVIVPNLPEILTRKLNIFCTGLTPTGPRHWSVRSSRQPTLGLVFELLGYPDNAPEAVV